MDWKENYRERVAKGESPPCPHLVPGTAVRRIAEMYSTAHVGNMSYVEARKLCEDPFRRLFEQREALPITFVDFDAHAEVEIRHLTGKLQGRLGIAQKMFNLFHKDLWAWDELRSSQCVVIHVPLDRGVIEKMKDPPNAWESWTKVVANDEQAFQARWDEYLVMQARYRRLWRTSSFRYPIEMEQFIWGKF